MSNKSVKLPFDDFEIAYSTLAEAIDQAGEKNETVFLTKLVLLLAHEKADVDAFQHAVRSALQDLDH
jgi:hypothetical protein